MSTCYFKVISDGYRDSMSHFWREIAVPITNEVKSRLTVWYGIENDIPTNNVASARRNGKSWARSTFDWDITFPITNEVKYRLAVVFYLINCIPFYNKKNTLRKCHCFRKRSMLKLNGPRIDSADDKWERWFVISAEMKSSFSSHEVTTA